MPGVQGPDDRGSGEEGEGAGQWVLRHNRLHVSVDGGVTDSKVRIRGASPACWILSGTSSACWILCGTSSACWKLSRTSSACWILSAGTTPDLRQWLEGSRTGSSLWPRLRPLLQAEGRQGGGAPSSHRAWQTEVRHILVAQCTAVGV